MKTLFTICLVPVAFVGLGILASAGWNLFKLGWHMAKEWCDFYKKLFNQ